MKTEILIAGGGVGGCAAALAAAESGRRVVMTEESDWIGGQLTSQAVPPDEHGWIERFGCTATYRRFREGVRNYYRRNYPLTGEAREKRLLNPGNGWVSPICHEPRAALAVLGEMLAPHLASGRIEILAEHIPVSANVTGDRVTAVKLLDLESGSERTIESQYFLDATELGDLLPITGTDYVTGFESRTETGEPSAPIVAQPQNSQAFSICFVLEHRDGEEHVIDKPAEYEFWRDFEPLLTPPWPGRLLSWTITHPRLMTPLSYHFDPIGESGRAFSGLWTYRRILDRRNFLTGAFDGDLCLVNWPQTDYLPGDICNLSLAGRETHILRARQQSLSLIYWLQTEAPRPDGGIGWKGLKLRGDVTGSRAGDLGLAKMPYIRESRRIRAEFTITEEQVSQDLRPGMTLAESYPDTVGIGSYRIDLHPSTGGDNYIDVPSLPFQIPLGALIPQRMENLLPACKNIGTTHITNGCYRLHPVEWNIGEAAGALAAFCLDRGCSPRQVLKTAGLLEDYQRMLERRGVELHWPDDLNLEEGDPHAHAR